ncbi:hypothetical protein BJY04DRAFT_218125 [Aspergillus karnatakaensis]|uniref:aromatic alcohol reductase n=1 Tax=Aspergillus karnatakaensis TaxID=1810916 RepID=UPI003CCD4295
MTLPRISLAGATGNLGAPILSALLDANYPVTALTRQSSQSTSSLPNHPNLTIARVDFTSVESLTSALQESQSDIVISALATLAIGAQNPLIDAAVAAGVKRFIPAEFGMDSLNPLVRELPVCAPKAATQEYLQKKVEESGDGVFSWTGIANGMFLDWCLEQGIILNLEERKATLYNGGDVVFSVALLRDVVRAVVGVAENLEETRDRLVLVHSARVSQNQLLEYAKERDGREWEVVVKSTEDVKRESFEELGKGEAADVEAAMLGFCIVGTWDTAYGCDFGARVDNGLFGVKELSEDELREVVWGLM